VATGIVQEFQFGMNWSEYSRFVGDVFGAPLAMEALAAFFLESTFLGLWIFGWDRLPKKVHLACMWAFAIGTNLSAYFIIAANSWMQHPVGAEFNPETGRAEMNDIWAVLTNNTTLVAFPHVIATAFLVAGAFVCGVAVYWMVKETKAERLSTVGANVADGADTVADSSADAGTSPRSDAPMYRTAARFGAVTMLIASVAVIVTGDIQAKLMFEQQPIKMAAAEGLCETETNAPFSLLTIGDLNGDCDSVRHIIAIPGLTSYLAEGDFDAEVRGLNELQVYYTERYGEGDYQPNLAVTYWSFRFMIGLGMFSGAVALATLWLTRRGRVSDSTWLRRAAVYTIPTPFLAGSFGWIFTEMGRQPFVVAPNPTGSDQIFLMTMFGVSEAVSVWEVATSMTIFTIVYAVLGVFWYRLMVRYSAEGAPQVDSAQFDVGDDDDDARRPMSFAY
jgi:cytochrome d ubiquinol oxidase subunit I